MIFVHDQSKMSRDQLASIALERPEGAGGLWKGIQHNDLLTAVEDACRAKGWDVHESAFALSNNKQTIVGAVSVDIGGITVPGTTLGVGFESSNDRTKSLRLYVGGTIEICTNGLVTGEVVLSRNHTYKVDLPEELGKGLDRYKGIAAQMQAQIDALAARTLSSDESDELLMKAGRDAIMPWSAIGKIDAEYRKPKHGEHDQKTSWGLLQAMTQIVKTAAPLSQMKKIRDFRAILPSETATA